MKKIRGDVPESRVFTKNERKNFAWAADQAITLWKERQRLAIRSGNAQGSVLAKWNIRRATRLLERIRPSAKPCSRCKARKPIGSFYWHQPQGRHASRCADCCREVANDTYRKTCFLKNKQKEILLPKEKELIQETMRQP